MELVGLCIWSWIVQGRFSLTRDFAIYQQAAFLFAHGMLNPPSTVTYGAHVSFYQDHAFFLWSVLSAVWRVLPSPAGLLWLQNLAAFGAQWIAFEWICSAAAVEGSETQRIPVAVCAGLLGLTLLVVDPFILWSQSFDLHSEAFATLFVVAAAYDFIRAKPRGWVWVVLALLCGNVADSYLTALGFSLVLYGKPWLKGGLMLALVGFGGAEIVTALGETQGTQLSDIYAPLLRGTTAQGVNNLSVGSLALALTTHPGRALNALWVNRLNLWGTLSPAGLLGVVWPPVLLPVALVAIESNLATAVFGFTGFQTFPVYILVPVGSVMVLLGIARQSTRLRRLSLIAMTVLAVNTIVWAIVWDRAAPNQWLRVSPRASDVLGRVLRQVRSSDEVIASQGFIGLFAARRWVYPYVPVGPRGQLAIAVHAPRVWIILSPNQGISTTSTVQTDSTLKILGADDRFRLAAHRAGVWAFESDRRLGAGQLTLSDPSAPSEPAWLLNGPAGESVMTGPERDWYTASNGRAGYVTDGAYWREPPGSYQATVALSVSGSADAELWDATSNVLLARDVLPSTNSRQVRIQLRGGFSRLKQTQAFSGVGIWSRLPQEPVGDQLEVRVYSPGGNNQVNVYDVGLQASALPHRS